MNEACLIPARYNSSRFPGKLLAMARGRSVLERTIGSALTYFDREQIFIATDDERIEKHVKPLGIRCLWTSPSCMNGTERIAEAVNNCPLLQTIPILVNLQGDHPCVRKETLQAAIDVLKMDKTAAMSTVAVPICLSEDFYAPHIVKVVADLQGNALYFSRSPIPYTAQGVPPNALHHIGLYCFRREYLLQYPHIAPSRLQLTEDLEQLKLLEMGWRIKLAIVEDPAIGIDIPADLVRLEDYLLKEERICQSSTCS